MTARVKDDEERLYKKWKRYPHHVPMGREDIYVTRKKPAIVFIKRGLQLLSMPETKAIHIHALGAAVNVATQIAAAIQRDSPHVALRMSVATSSVPLVDEFVPLTAASPDVPPQVRWNSAIHIALTVVH